MSLYRGLIAVALISGISLYLANNPEANQPLNFATNHWLGYEPLYVAKDLDLIDEKLVNVRTLSSTTDVFRALRHGEVAGAALTLDEALLLAHEGMPLSIIGVADISNGADAVLLSNRFEINESMAGKRIAYEGNVLGAFMVARMLDKLGLSLMDVALIEAAPHEHAELLAAGTVDAVVTYEPFVTRLKTATHKIFTSKDIPGEVLDVLVVDMKQTSPKQVAHLLSIWNAGVEQLLSRRDDVIHAVSKRHQLPVEDITAAINDIGFPNTYRSHDQAMIFVDNEHLSRTADRLWQVMQHVGLGSKVASVPSIDVELEHLQ